MNNAESIVCDFNSLSKIVVEFNKKINSFEFVFNNQLSQVFGVKQNNVIDI